MSNINVSKITIIKNGKENPKTVAILNFDSEQSASQAQLALNDCELNGHKLAAYTGKIRTS